MMNLSENNILEVLDKAVSDTKFPSFSNANIEHCGARLNIFSDQKEKWIIIIQWIGYIKSNGLFSNLITGFQNDTNPYIFDLINISDLLVDENTLINKDGTFIGDIFNFKITINGVIKEFELTEQDYYDLNILNLDVFPMTIICRLCTTKLSKDIFKTSEKILEIIKVKNNIKPFMIVDDWEHPNIIEGELPSQTESFRMLSRAIALNDPSLFKPKKIYFNTWEWGYWNG